MIDPVSTTVGIISGTKGLVELAKAAIDFAKKEKNSAELINLIQDIREKAQEIREENLDLRHKVAELEKQLQVNEKLEFDKNNLLWIVEGDERQGPYCSQCKDSKGHMVRLHAQPRGNRGTFHQCPTCKAQPDIHALAPQEIKRTRSSHDSWMG